MMVCPARTCLKFSANSPRLFGSVTKPAVQARAAALAAVPKFNDSCSYHAARCLTLKLLQRGRAVAGLVFELRLEQFYRFSAYTLHKCG